MDITPKTGDRMSVVMVYNILVFFLVISIVMVIYGTERLIYVMGFK